jgi:hypothetical protein
MDTYSEPKSDGVSSITGYRSAISTDLFGSRQQIVQFGQKCQVAQLLVESQDVFA